MHMWVTQKQWNLTKEADTEAKYKYSSSAEKLGSFQEYKLKEQTPIITGCSKWDSCWTYKGKILQNRSGEQIVLWNHQSLDIFETQLDKAMNNMIKLWS